jgi:hypothetical protein
MVVCVVAHVLFHIR